MTTWQTLGNPPPRELAAARHELHNAVQLVSIAVSKVLVPHEDDDSHTALTWLAASDQWVGAEIPSTGGLRAGFRPASFELTLGTEDDPAARRLALAGKTLADGLAWLRRELAGRGVPTGGVALDLHYDIPPHPVASGAPFGTGHGDALAELRRWYANAEGLLAGIAAEDPEATAILTWPHHFDIAVLLPAGPADERFAKSIGVGLSPGDKYYDEPYFYVTAWPDPEGLPMPELPLGHWHTDAFVGAILTGTELLADDGQEEATRSYLEAGIAGARSLLTASQ